MSTAFIKKSIIKKNGYQVIDTLDPTTVVLADGDSNGQFEKYSKYRLVSNEVDFYWTSKGFETAMLFISYKGTELVRYDDPTFQLVIDYLNQFDKLSKQEIEKLVLESKADSKTQLESEIENLKVEKEKLLQQISILKQIEEKKEELKLLLTKLND